MECLHRGLFWYVEGELIGFPVPCDEDGRTGVCGAENNHERLWRTLPRRIRRGRPYDFYPRGRVEVRHGKVTVYINPHICTDEIAAQLRRAFMLPDETVMCMKADGSRHYRCYMDE